MGKLGPAVLAFILNCGGVYIFRTPRDIDCFPPEAYFILLTSVFVLLSDIKIYPVCYRRLYSWLEFLIEFVLSLFIMEFVMDDFWLPLLGAFITAFTRLMDFLNEKLENIESKIHMLIYLFDVIKTPGGLHVISMVFSSFALICVLQATNTVDFHIIGCCGGKAFVKDTMHRSKRFFRKLLHKAKHQCRNRHISFAPGTKDPSDSLMRDLLDEDERDDDDEYRYCRSPRD